MPATLEQLADVRSQLATGLMDYLQSLMNLPDQDAGSGTKPEVYLGNRNPTMLYTEPDVLKRVRRLPPAQWRESGREAEPELARHETEHRPSLPPEALDIGEEALYGQKPDESEERVPWSQELEGLNHGHIKVVVLTGPPGSGKTLLGKVTSRELARRAKEDLSTQSKGVDEVELPLYVPLRNLAEQDTRVTGTPEERLREALRDTLRARGCKEVVLNYLFGEPSSTPANFHEISGGHVWQSRAWLFLDGLDEVDHTERLKLYFNVLSEWRCHLLITSRPHAYVGWGKLPFSQVAEYRLAPFTEQQSDEFVGKWYGQDARQQQIRDLVQRSHSVRQVAQSPLLLTLLCWVGERQTLSPEITRTELYDRVVLDLLGLQKGGGEPDHSRAKNLLPLISDVALAWFQSNKAKNPITHERLIEWIERHPRRPRPLGRTESGTARCLDAAATARLSPLQQAEFLLDELLHKRVLYPVDARRTGYAFPHRSFAEYLAACALARRLEPNKLAEEDNKKFRAAQKEKKVTWQLVDRKAWHPIWQEVIILLVGKLKDPARLLNILSSPDPTPTNPTGDDLFRHRLVLAALCLLELDSITRNSRFEIIDRITTRAFSLWWGYLRIDSVGVFPHLASALVAIAQVNGRINDTPLLTWLCMQLASGDQQNQLLATQTVKSIGKGAATPVIVAHVMEALHSLDAEVSRAAAEALTAIGESAATPQILARLSQALRDPHPSRRVAAAKAVAGLGSVAATDEILACLADLVEDEDWSVRYNAAETISRVGSMGNMTAIQIAFDRLINLFHSEDLDVRRTAARALGGLGTAIAKSQFLERLADLLRHKDPYVRQATAQSLTNAGNAFATPAIVAGLTHLLRDKDMVKIYWGAAWSPSTALASMGAEIVTPQFVAELAEMLSDGDWEVRWNVTEYAVKEMKTHIATDEFIAHLSTLLRHKTPELRESAARAVGNLGKKAATEEILDCLDNLICDTDRHLRREAIIALGRTESPRALAILSRDGDPLYHETAEIRSAAQRLLASVGIESPKPGNIARLLELAHDNHSELALDAVANIIDDAIDDAAAVRPLLSGLLKIMSLSKDVSSDTFNLHVNPALVRVVRHLGSAGATPEFLSGLVDLLSTFGAASAAAEAIAGIGSAAATPEILDRLILLLGKDSDNWPANIPQTSAIRAIEGIGGAAATPEVLTHLVRLLRNEKPRWGAARAIRRMMEQGIRVFECQDGRLFGRNIAELSR